MGDFTENKGAGGLGEGMSEDLCVEHCDLKALPWVAFSGLAGRRAKAARLSTIGPSLFWLPFCSEQSHPEGSWSWVLGLGASQK